MPAVEPSRITKLNSTRGNRGGAAGGRNKPPVEATEPSRVTRLNQNANVGPNPALSGNTTTVRSSSQVADDTFRSTNNLRPRARAERNRRAGAGTESRPAGTQTSTQNKPPPTGRGGTAAGTTGAAAGTGGAMSGGSGTGAGVAATRGSTANWIASKLRGAGNRASSGLSRLRSAATTAGAAGAAFYAAQQQGASVADRTNMGRPAGDGMYFSGEDPDNPGVPMASDTFFPGATERALPNRAPVATEAQMNEAVGGGIPRSTGGGRPEMMRYDPASGEYRGLRSQTSAPRSGGSTQFQPGVARRDQFTNREQVTGGLRADSVVSDDEMRSIRLDARRARQEIEKSARNVSPGRRASILASAPTEAEIAGQMIDNLSGARSPNQAQSDAIENRLSENQSIRDERAAGLRSQREPQSYADRMQDISNIAGTLSGSIYNQLDSEGLGDLYESPEQVEGAFTGFLTKTDRMQQNGQIPSWVDPSMSKDLFTLSHSLRNAQSQGFFADMGFGRDQVGGDIDPAQTLSLLGELVENENGDKWTNAQGTEFRLSDLGPAGQRIYQQFKEMYEG